MAYLAAVFVVEHTTHYFIVAAEIGLRGKYRIQLESHNVEVGCRVNLYVTGPCEGFGEAP